MNAILKYILLLKNSQPEVYYAGVKNTIRRLEMEGPAVDIKSVFHRLRKYETFSCKCAFIVIKY